MMVVHNTSKVWYIKKEYKILFVEYFIDLFPGPHPLTPSAQLISFNFDYKIITLWHIAQWGYIL